jgi:hypothetical protein
MPSQSHASDCDLLGASCLLCGDPGRHDELHAVLVVFRREVVPVALQRHDLADGRRDGIGVPEHTALDLGTAHELLDENLLVVLECELDRILERAYVADDCDPDARAEPRGLDDNGEAKRVLDPVGGGMRSGPCSL